MDLGGLLELLPYLGAGAGGYLQGRQDKLKMQQLQQAMDLAASQDERQNAMLPIQQDNMMANTEHTIGTENRAQGEYQSEGEPAGNEFLSALGLVRPGYVAPKPEASLRDVKATAPLFPSTADYTRAKAAEKTASARSGESVQRRINELVAIKARVSAAIDAGKPLDAAILQDPDISASYKASKGNLRQMLKQIDDMIARLQGGGGPAPAASSSTRAGRITLNITPAPVQ